jgi:hypothetical protein
MVFPLITFKQIVSEPTHHFPFQDIELVGPEPLW